MLTNSFSALVEMQASKRSKRKTYYVPRGRYSDVNTSRRKLLPLDNNTSRRKLLPLDNNTSRRKLLPLDSNTSRRKLLPLDSNTSRRKLLPLDSNTSRRKLLPLDSNTSRRKLLPLDNNTSRRKLLPTNHIGIWRFGGSDFLTSVPNRWSVSRCIQEIKKRLDHTGDLDLWAMNRCVLLDKRQSLAAYEGLTKLFVVQHPHCRPPNPYYTTSMADVTDPYGEDECVQMPCAHAISPENLYLYSWNEIKSGNIEVRCPALLYEYNTSVHCNRVWDFKEVSRLACLSSDERGLFLSVLFINWLEKNKNVYLCPKCGEAVIASCKDNGYFECYFCQKRGGAYTFCTRCLEPTSRFYECSNAECLRSFPQTRSLLYECPERTIVGVHGCPSVRACPGCECIIRFENTDMCKLMTCPNRTCRTRFCFICLSVPSRQGSWPCGGAYSKCRPAPRQYVH